MAKTGYFFVFKSMMKPLFSAIRPWSEDLYASAIGNNRKNWLAIICTDISLNEKDVIRIYGHRWDIEVFFKTCGVSSPCRSLPTQLKVVCEKAKTVCATKRD